MWRREAVVGRCFVVCDIVLWRLFVVRCVACLRRIVCIRGVLPFASFSRRPLCCWSRTRRIESFSDDVLWDKPPELQAARALSGALSRSSLSTTPLSLSTKTKNTLRLGELTCTQAVRHHTLQPPNILSCRSSPGEWLGLSALRAHAGLMIPCRCAQYPLLEPTLGSAGAALAFTTVRCPPHHSRWTVCRRRRASQCGRCR